MESGGKLREAAVALLALGSTAVLVFFGNGLSRAGR